MSKFRRNVCVALISVGLSVTAGLSQSAQSSWRTGIPNYYYCILVDDPHKTVYFSQVFKGSEPSLYTYEKAFGSRLSTLYPHVIGSPKCIANTQEEALKRNEVLARENWKFVYNKTIDISWSYTSAAISDLR